MARMIMVGSTPWSTAPRMLKTSPASQMMMNSTERPSAELRLKFSMICGENTTIQHAMEIDPQMPEMASMSMLLPFLIGGSMIRGEEGVRLTSLSSRDVQLCPWERWEALLMGVS